MLLSLLIDQHKTAIEINEEGQSNAMTYFSTRANNLIMSHDFFELHKIHEILYEKLYE